MKNSIAELIDEEILSPLYPNESNAQFIERVCGLCLDEIEANKGFAPAGFGVEVVDEIEMEVIELFRAKTYGFFNLQEYRSFHLKKRLG